MMRVKVKAIVVDEVDREQTVDVWLDVAEQRREKGTIRLEIGTTGGDYFGSVKFTPTPPFADEPPESDGS